VTLTDVLKDEYSALPSPRLERPAVTSFEWHLRLPSSGPVSRTGPLGSPIRYGNVTKSSRNARADGVSSR